MKQDTIFLQIKVGQLLPMGFVEKDDWQPLPDDYKKNRVQLNYVCRELVLLDVNYGVGFALTGFLLLALHISDNI